APVAGDVGGEPGGGGRIDRARAVPRVAAVPGGSRARLRAEPDGRAPGAPRAPRRPGPVGSAVGSYVDPRARPGDGHRRRGRAMTGYPWVAAAVNLGVTAVVVVAMFGAALAVAMGVRGGRHDGIDVVWGAGFAVVALVSHVLAHDDGDLWRQVLIT